MQSEKLEFRPGASIVGVSWAFLICGLVFTGIAGYHMASGTPLMITEAHGGFYHPASRQEELLFGGMGVLVAAFGLLILIGSTKARFVIEPEGFVIRNMLGRDAGRVPWEQVTGLRQSNYRGRYYVVSTDSQEYRLRGYRDIEGLVDEISRRSPNLREIDL